MTTIMSNKPTQSSLFVIIATIVATLFVLQAEILYYVSSHQNQNKNQSHLLWQPLPLPAAEPEAKLNFTRPRRLNAHWCRRRGLTAQTRMAIKILQEEFGFVSVDATKTDDWDIIFGGYPHCGSKDWDFEMKTGLNQQLNERGWSNLKPHQVWYPCMGCKNAYCNKRELCRIVRGIDPNACFLLPDDRDRLVDMMDGKTLWVMKRDGTYFHKHIGSNVFYIQSEQDFPPEDEMADSTFLVQPYHNPHLGAGKYKRKSEVRFYIAVTSTSPLRAYAYTHQWATLAPYPYDITEGNLTERCIHDTHPDHIPCKNIGIEQAEKELTFESYALLANITKSNAEAFQLQTYDLLSKIIHGAEPILQANKINQGITESGASCFHWMRVDVGISSELKPYVFEINEFNSFGPAHFKEPRISQYNSFKDLINMIGLDKYPLPASERGEYELTHMGDYIML